MGENDASGRNFIGLNGNGANAERRRCSIDRVSASAARGCTMICRKCGLEKPPGEFYDGKYRCKPCLAVYFRRYNRERADRPRNHRDPSYQVTDVCREAPRPASVYVKPEAIYHARCEQPLCLTGYLSSMRELHFRCYSCGESVFLPTVAVERVERR